MKYIITSVYYDIYCKDNKFYAQHYFKKHKPILLKAINLTEAKSEVHEMLNKDKKNQLNH